MADRVAGTSRPRARITGIVYLFYFLTAAFAHFLVSGRLVVYGDAVNIVGIACYIAVTLLFYHMFKPVNRNLSLVAALFSLVGCAITALSVVHLVPSHVSPLLFFGPYCVLIGYLIFTSTFLPRILGVLMMFAGFGWLIFLSPPLEDQLSSYIEVPGVLAEGSLMLWLLVMGVNVTKWEEAATRSGPA